MRQRLLITASLLALAALLPARGQESDSTTTEPKRSLVEFTGSATVSADFYRYSGDTSDFIPRRPSSLMRLVMNSELKIGSFFSLPLNLMISSEETNVVTPWTGQPSFGQYLQNQMNTIGISPRFGWAQFYLGSHTPQNTGMAFDGAQLFGVGASFTPGRFRLLGSTGVSQRAVEVDTVNGVIGSYRQHALIARLGYGDEGGEEFAIGLSFARLQDDTNSIETITQTELISVPDSNGLPKAIPVVERHHLMPMPIEGTSSSLRIFVPLLTGLSFQGEAALCNYTRDQSADALEEEIPVLSDIATQRVSSRIDYALTGTIGFTRPTFGIAAKALYVGPGFVTLGNPYASSDRQELTLNPRLALFQGRLNLSGGIGYRINNLSGTKADRTTQLIGAAVVQAQATGRLSLDLSYNNMGMNSNNRVDTFRLNNVAQSFSFTPTYVIAGEKGTHAISGQLGMDTYTDRNAIAGEENNTSTRTIGGFYSLSLSAIPLTATLGGSNTLQKMSLGDVTIDNLALSVGYRFFNEALRPSLTLSASQSASIDDRTDRRLSLRLGTEWRLSQMISLNLNASTDFNTYDVIPSERQIDEQYVQTSVTARF